MKKIFSLVAVASLLFFGCDKVDLPNQSHNSVTPTNDTIRKVFIEDFTGHTCPNCPGAARMIKDTLEVLYPGQIISMAVHYGFWAEPCPPHGLPAGATPGTFTEDFRVPTEDADYNSIYQVDLNFNFPSGLINRYAFAPQAVADWPTIVSNILDTTMSAYIKIHPSYNTTTRDLNVTVSGLFMKDTTGTYNIALYLTESGLTGSQTDNTVAGGITNGYVFDNVFRACINSPGLVGGQQVATGTILNGTLINYTMTNTYSVPVAFNDNNCKIIAIIFKTSDQGVLQAAECSLR